ncbi:Chondroitin sulfate synthase 2 [Trichinella papuae]|uniref:Hexosyltransferase n=1 Tax=Trichinella papuae TaxID=268474 RepID=A0A0V1MYW4_9BILA|nr:Chondroitin sulfate synthase 2 [Trichinella papuae]
MNVHFKMKRRSSLWSWFRNLSPLFLGLLCGSVLSSLFQNLFQAQLCEPSCVEESTTAEIIDLDLDGHLGKFDNDESSASGDFRPTLATVNNASLKARPRFFATEIGIRQRLFIGFMVAVSDLQLLYDTMDNTLKEYANRVVFFVEKSSTNTSIFFGANVIELDTYVVKKLPSLAFDYINKRFNQFDWYFMVANRTIVNRFAIDRLMKQLSAGDSLFFGQLSFDNVCSLEAGILISRDLLDKLVDCNQEDAYNSIADYRCIFSHLQCTDTWKNVKFRSLKFRTDQWMKSNLVSEDYEQILTVQGLESQSEVEMVQAELRRLESYHLQARLQSIRQEVLNLSNLLSENLTLPLGLAEPWRSADRYDLLKWDFFNATHMFPASSDEETAILLRGYDRLDVLAVSGFAIDWLKCKHGCCAGDGSSGGRLKSKCSDSAKFLSGYRRFDPNRGVDYVLDFLEINHHEQAQARMERVYLLRPVGNAELVPVPFVTESTSVTMLLRVRGFEIEQAVLFLDQFKRLCLDEDQRCNLILLMQRQANGTDDAMEHSLRKLRSVFRSWNAARGSRVQVVKLIGEACLVRMVDLVVSRLKTTRLLLLASPWMHLDREMLNRVRMQTVENFQAFFPVPFVHYHPTLTGLKQQWNANVGVRQHSQLGRNLGRFDRSNFEIASFYSTDYAYVRSLLHTENSFPNVAAQTTDSKITADGRYIFKLFCNTNQKNQDNGRKFHVMRAVDPAFQLIHPNTANCNLAADMTELEACLSMKKQNLGSRIQMASYLFNAKTTANLPTN